ncbi:MAG: hypothetical protein JXR30_03450 [Alphaproteobacteria bacterium]|nr:hypothetical protein [Alphaproteobacteria bacterium]
MYHTNLPKETIQEIRRKEQEKFLAKKAREDLARKADENVKAFFEQKEKNFDPNA